MHQDVLLHYHCLSSEYYREVESECIRTSCFNLGKNGIRTDLMLTCAFVWLLGSRKLSSIATMHCLQRTHAEWDCMVGRFLFVFHIKEVNVWGFLIYLFIFFPNASSVQTVCANSIDLSPSNEAGSLCFDLAQVATR